MLSICHRITEASSSENSAMCIRIAIYFMKQHNQNFSTRQQMNLLKEMVRTDFKLRYQGSVLGYIWSVLKPLFLFAILYVVFTKFLQFGRGVPNYSLSLLLALVLWNFFGEATSGSLKSIVGKGGLMRKIYTPRYLIPLSAIASAFINLLLNLLVVFIFVVFAEGTALSWSTLVIFPLLLLQLVVLATGVGLFLAAVYVKFRDINYIWEVIRQALFYSIPIIYPITLIPFEEVKMGIMLNPIAQIIQDSRASITYSESLRITDVYDNALIVLVPIALTALSLVIGLRYFSKHADSFAENV